MIIKTWKEADEAILRMENLLQAAMSGTILSAEEVAELNSLYEQYGPTPNGSFDHLIKQSN